MALKRSNGPGGKLVVLEHTSRILKGNRLGDPYVRKLGVWLPAEYDQRAGRGLGKRLVQECIAFARGKGYRKLVLWTQSNLAAARGIYKSCGFEIKKTERHTNFGVKLAGEYWELVLI